jgi:hypothetical protein
MDTSVRVENRIAESVEVEASPTLPVDGFRDAALFAG